MSNAAQRTNEAWNMRVEVSAVRMASFMERLDPVWSYQVQIIDRLYADDVMEILDKEEQQEIKDLGKFVAIAIHDRKKGLRKYIVQPGAEEEMEKILTGLAELWRTELFADFGFTLDEGNAMLQNILTKLDEVNEKLKKLDDHSLSLATLTEKVGNIEKSVDGQRETRRWVIGILLVFGGLLGWQNLVALWKAIF